jgi:hypothetical protein
MLQFNNEDLKNITHHIYNFFVIAVKIQIYKFLKAWKEKELLSAESL